MIKLNFIQKRKIKHLLLINGSVIVASMLLKKAFDYGYEKINHRPPPEKLRNNSKSALHVIGWGMLTGAAAGITRIVARDLVEINVTETAYETETSAI